MQIRKTTEQDVGRVMEIYAHAREFMKRHGNPNQWGPTNWPPAALIHEDIRCGNSYVCVDDAGNLIGTFYYISGKQQSCLDLIVLKESNYCISAEPRAFFYGDKKSEPGRICIFRMLRKYQLI